MKIFAPLIAFAAAEECKSSLIFLILIVEEMLNFFIFEHDRLIQN